jgi:hypothetical protein
MIDYQDLHILGELSDDGIKEYRFYDVTTPLKLGLIVLVGEDNGSRWMSEYQITDKGQALLRFVNDAVETFLRDHEGDE